VLLVVKPEHRDALETSLDFATLAEPRCRAERPRLRVSAETATLVCLAAPRAPRRRNPRLNPWPKTLDWGLAGELRRPSSPAAAPPHARVPRRWIQFRRVGSNLAIT
jgi:hypothetical protein